MAGERRLNSTQRKWSGETNGLLRMAHANAFREVHASRDSNDNDVTLEVSLTNKERHISLHAGSPTTGMVVIQSYWHWVNTRRTDRSTTENEQSRVPTKGQPTKVVWSCRLHTHMSSIDIHCPYFGTSSLRQSCCSGAPGIAVADGYRPALGGGGQGWTACVGQIVLSSTAQIDWLLASLTDKCNFRKHMYRTSLTCSRQPRVEFNLSVAFDSFFSHGPRPLEVPLWTPSPGGRSDHRATIRGQCSFRGAKR